MAVGGRDDRILRGARLQIVSPFCAFFTRVFGVVIVMATLIIHDLQEKKTMISACEVGKFFYQLT